MPKASAAQQRELGVFLASRRARAHPGDFGLAPGRRRTPGLRREEVAVLAGLSVSWYTWLEQGRDIHPSADALARLSNVFRLDRVECAHLFALASLPAPAVPTEGDLTTGLEMLVHALDPVPAYVRNARLDILAWNSAIAAVFMDYALLRPQDRNTLRLLFLHAPYRTRIVDWEAMARGMMSTFRAARAQARDQTPFDDLIDELTSLSPEFRDWWPDTEVKGFDEGSKRLRQSDGSHLEFIYVALAPQGRPDLSLVTYIPRPRG